MTVTAEGLVRGHLAQARDDDATAPAGSRSSRPTGPVSPVAVGEGEPGGDGVLVAADPGDLADLGGDTVPGSGAVPAAMAPARNAGLQWLMESFLIHWGYAAVFLFGFLEACCVPIPSGITFGFAGVLAGEGHLSIVGIIVVGTIAELIGSFVAYGVGQAGGRPLVHRFGRYLLITRADIDRAERFGAGRGGGYGRSRSGAPCRSSARSCPLWRESSRCPRCCSGS